MTFDDQLSLDLLEQVTYTSARDGGDVTRVVPHALIQDKSTHEGAAGFGRYQAGDFDVAIRTVEFAGIRPKPGDSLADADGLRYTVLTVKVGELASFARLGCRVLAIAADLHDLCDVEIPVAGQGATGARLNAAWGVKYLQLPCRLQPAGEDADRDFGKDGPRRKFDLWVDRQIDPRDAGGNWGRVKVTGKTYDVTGYVQAERLDSLPKLEVVLRP